MQAGPAHVSRNTHNIQHSRGACRQQARDARCVEAVLSEPDSRAQAGASGADDDGVVLMVDHGVPLGRIAPHAR